MFLAPLANDTILVGFRFAVNGAQNAGQMATPLIQGLLHRPDNFVRQAAHIAFLAAGLAHTLPYFNPIQHLIQGTPVQRLDHFFRGRVFNFTTMLDN